MWNELRSTMLHPQISPKTQLVEQPSVHCSAAYYLLGNSSLLGLVCELRIRLCRSAIKLLSNKPYVEAQKYNFVELCFGEILGASAITIRMSLLTVFMLCPICYFVRFAIQPREWKNLENDLKPSRMHLKMI